MSEWKVVSKNKGVFTDAFMNLAILGVYASLRGKSCTYVVEHKLTGERKTVKAPDSYELGDSIEEADFKEG
jgi:hypothetical protein